VIISGAALPPTSDGSPFTLADGWGWALVNKNAHRAEAVDLLNWLTEPGRLAGWTQAAAVLPTRAAVLAGWGNTRFAALAATALAHAQLQPSERILGVVGPVLRQATDDVLNGRATPEAAAQTAARTLAEGAK
jgi:ABC-type glycerol-3-phosphate transport system substrate-binding protein